MPGLADVQVTAKRLVPISSPQFLIHLAKEFQEAITNYSLPDYEKPSASAMARENTSSFASLTAQGMISPVEGDPEIE